jgi:isocitrate dehydrogenase (NAD+)
MQSAAEILIPATLIAGDGIGPEIFEATVMVPDTLRAPFAWELHKAGMSGVEAFGDPLPQSTLDSIRRTRLALKGPLTTPVGGGYRSSNVRLREEFRLYANVRPARTLVPGDAKGRHHKTPARGSRGFHRALNGCIPASEVSRIEERQ